MKKIIFLTLALCYVLCTYPLFAKEKPWNLEIRKVSKNVLVVTSWGVNVVAVKSQKGIVVIDAHNFPAIASDIREAIEREFGRKDFTYLINTHHHLDQTGGNQVFPEAVVLGTKCCADNMKARDENINYFLDKGKEKIDMLEGEIKSLSGIQSDEVEKMVQEKNFLEYMLTDLKNNYKEVLPQRYLNDKETLDLGDMTLKFYCLSNCHSESDVIIVIPEEKTAIIGDLNDKLWLAKSDANKGPKWISEVYSILNENGQIINLIGGHETNLTHEQSDYRNAVAFPCDKSKGKKSSAYQFSFAVEKKGISSADDIFKNLINNDNFYFNPDQFVEVIVHYIKVGKDAEALKTIQLMASECSEEILNNTELESAINSYGYQLMKKGYTDLALKYFYQNTKMFPNSWNVHDSYAEALLQKGETIPALESYIASLKLNANNRNILKVLKKLDANWTIRMPEEAKKISELMK